MIMDVQDFVSSSEWLYVRFTGSIMEVFWKWPGRDYHRWNYEATYQGLDWFAQDLTMAAMLPDQDISVQEADLIFAFVRLEFDRREGGL